MRWLGTRERLVILVAAFAAGGIAVACTSVYGSDIVQNPIVADAGEPGDAGAGADGEDPHDFPLEPLDAADDRVESDAGGMSVDGSACAATDCDCDKDGFLDLNKAGCADGGGLPDCDDFDSRVRPGQGYLDILNPPRGGDWNCNGDVEHTGGTTVTPCGQRGRRCSGEGFTDDPKCGETGHYVVCVSPNNNGCRTQSAGDKKQACR